MVNGTKAPDARSGRFRNRILPVEPADKMQRRLSLWHTSDMDRPDARDVIQRQLHTGHGAPIWMILSRRHICNALGMRGRYRFGFVLTHFRFLLLFVRINGCKQKYRAGLIPYTVLLEDGTANTHRRKSCPESCQNGEKRVYLSQRCGFDPLCRWTHHLRRCLRVAALRHCRYFLFS